MGDLGIQIGLLILITLESGIQILTTGGKCVCGLRRSRLVWGGWAGRGGGAPGKATPSDYRQAGLGGSERGLLAAATPGPHLHMVC